MDADALVVVAIERQAEQVLLAKTRRLAARAADALVLIGRIGMTAVLRHVGVDLVLADDDQVHAVVDHLREHVGPAGEHVRDDGRGLHERPIVNDFSGSDGKSARGKVLLVELARGLAVPRTDKLKEGVRRGTDRRRICVRAGE